VTAHTRRLIGAVITAAAGVPGVLGGVYALVLLDARLQDGETARLYARARTATAQVVDVGSDRLSVRYGNDVVSAEVDATIIEPGVDARTGDSIRIVYPEAHPYMAYVEGEAPYGGSLAGFYVLAVPLLVVSLCWRWWTTWRSDRLARTNGVTYRMIAELTAVDRVALYPLDSAVGDAALCTLRLREPSVVTPAGTAWAADVKGLPRPGGRVVLRQGTRSLDVRGAALLVSGDRRQHRRVVDDVQITRLRNNQRGTKSVVRWMVCTIVAVAACVIVGVVGFVRAGPTDRWMADGQRGIALIVERNDISQLAIVFRSGDDRRATTVPVGDSERFVPGQTYPAVQREADGHVRLLAEPYDWREPVQYMLAIAAACGWMAVHRIVRPANERRAPWRRGLGRRRPVN
jgi:hypothetical protein